MQTNDSHPLFDHVADDVHWTITGKNPLSGDECKAEFAGGVLTPFGAWFSEPFVPVHVRGVREDVDTVIVM